MANTTDYTRLLDGYALLAIKAYIANNYAAKSHTHTKSQITDFPSSMPASDVYAWAKAATKPSYTLDEVSDGSTRKLSNYLTKLTYEWNKDISFGSSGYLKIGSFQMYDSNVTINIDATTNQTFHGTVIIASQNTTASSIGSVHIVRVYDDPSGTIANSLRIVWTNGSRNYDVYFVPQAWSKNIIHIRANGIYGATDICISQTGTPPSTTSGLEPVNVLTTTFALLNHNHDTVYLGKTATAADSSKLNGQAASYYLNYNNLTNKPTIPSVSNATITIKQTGLSDQTFTLNGSATTITLADTNTWRPLGTGASDACAGNDSRLSDARPASDVYAWAKASTKPSYTASEVGALKNYGTDNSRPNGSSFTFSTGTNPVQMRSGATSGADIGIFYLSDDNAFVVNSGDSGFNFAVFDCDKGADFSSVDNAAFVILQSWGGIKMKGDLTVAGSISEAGTALSSKYLGISAKAADSSKLDGHALSYFITTDNIASQYVYHATNSDYATDSGYASNSAALGGNGPAYYLNYNNFTNTPSIPTESTVSGWGFTKNAGTVTQVKVGTAAYNPSSGVVSLPAYPTKSSWNYDDVYVKLTGNQSIAGTKTFTGKIEISDGQNSYIFTPGQGGDVVLELLDEQSNKTTVYLVNPNTPSTAQYIALRSWVNDQGFLKTAVTKLGSRTGDITIANLKTDLGLGSAAYTNSTAYATSGHTHTLSIASGGTASINLAANTTYTLTAGGKTYAFKTPPAGGGGYYSNQYNSAYYLSSNSGTTLFADDIQAGMAIVGLQGGNATMIGIGWPGLASGSFIRSLLFSGNRVDLTLTDQYQYYFKGLSIDMYNDDYYTLHIRANDYSDLYGGISSQNTAAVELHTSNFSVAPSGINASVITGRQYTNLGVVMHNINYTYSSTVLLKMNIRGNSANDSAITSYSSLCSLLYYAGHRSAATCLTCSGRYSSYSYVVLGVYATSYNSGLYLVYCSASSNTVNTTAIASGTVTDTLSASLVP